MTEETKVTEGLGSVLGNTLLATEPGPEHLPHFRCRFGLRRHRTRATLQCRLALED